MDGDVRRETGGKMSVLKFRKQLAIVVLAVITVLSFSLIACSGGEGSKSGGGISVTDKTNAKQVIIATGDLLTMMDFGLTDDDSPVTISEADPAYAEFFTAVRSYKKVADLDVQNISVIASIVAVDASTARPDQQTNYRFTITDASMKINGVDITFKAPGTFTAK